MGSLKLKGASLVITLTATAVVSFVAGWYLKKAQYKIKKFFDKDATDSDDEKDD